MNIKYIVVRNEVFRCYRSHKKIHARKYKDMKRLFKPLQWFLFVLALLSCVSILVIMALPINNAYVFISYIVLLLDIVAVDKLPDEWLFNMNEKEKESMEIIEYDKSFHNKVSDILIKYKLNTSQQIEILTKDCEKQLSFLTNKNIILSRIIEILIISPLSAMVLILIDGDRHLNLNMFLVVIFISVILTGIILIFSKLIGFGDSYNKDKCLLDALNGLEYYK